MKTVTVSKDKDCEMIKIKVGNKNVFEGNYWDFDSDTMTYVLREAGVNVVEKDYTYKST